MSLKQNWWVEMKEINDSRAKNAMKVISRLA
jgi:hypothetical protein